MRHPIRTTLCALLTALGASPALAAAPVPEPAARIEAARPAPPACVPAGEAGVWFDGTAVELCVWAPEATCFGFDPTTRALTTRPAPTDAVRTARYAPAGVEVLDAEALATAGNRHTVCAPAGAPCKEVPLGEGRVRWRSFSEDGRMVVYSVGPSDDDVATARRLHRFLVFATATGKLLKKHTYRNNSMLCGGARFVGDLLLVAVDVCAGPGGEAWFLNPKTGKHLGGVGGRGYFGAYQPSVWLRETDIVLLEQGGKRVAVHDRKTGAFERIVALVPEDALPTEAYGSTLFPRPDGDALVTLSGESSGTVLRLDSAALKVRERIVAPRCQTTAPPRDQTP